MAIETITIKDAGGVERQVYADQIGAAFAQVLKIAHGDDGVLSLAGPSAPLPTADVAVLAAVDTLETLLARLPSAGAASEVTLASILSATDSLEGFVDGLEAINTAIRDRLPAALITGALGTTDAGTYGYAAGTATATVDVPPGARVKRVTVLAGSGGSATVTIAGGATITIPAAGAFDEQIPGQATAGGDVVIGGTVASYYVSWVL